MNKDGFDFARTYAAMEDEELLALAKDSSTLIESAQAALQRELDKRELKPEPPETSSTEDSDSGFYCLTCKKRVSDPLACGECSTLICRICGTPLRMPEDADYIDDDKGADGEDMGERAPA